MVHDKGKLEESRDDGERAREWGDRLKSGRRKDGASSRPFYELRLSLVSVLGRTDTHRSSHTLFRHTMATLAGRGDLRRAKVFGERKEVPSTVLGVFVVADSRNKAL